VSVAKQVGNAIACPDVPLNGHNPLDSAIGGVSP
jgi:hypothetical protein